MHVEPKAKAQIPCALSPWIGAAVQAVKVAPGATGKAAGLGRSDFRSAQRSNRVTQAAGNSPPNAACEILHSQDAATLRLRMNRGQEICASRGVLKAAL